MSPPDGEGDVRVAFAGGRPFFRAARMSRRFDLVIVHFQPALYYRPRAPLSKVMTSAGLLWLSLVCPTLDIVVHEADTPALWRPDYLLLRLAFKRARRLSFHTDAERSRLERNYGISVRGVRIPHRVTPALVVSKDEARQRLGMADGGPIFVCPGFLQPSKGFDRAVSAFGGADSGRLFVVGSVREETPANRAYADALSKRCQVTPRATLVERFLAEDEFDLWVAAADWVVLPYRRSWSSGVLARAHALGTPAIVSAVGGLPEQAGEKDVVVHDDDQLASAIREASSRAAAPPPDVRHRPGPHTSDWDPELEPPDSQKGRRGLLLLFILASVLLAAFAQITLKHGMTQVTHRGASPLELGQPLTAVRRVAANPFVWLGLATFAVSAAAWLIVLSRASLSFAYPFASLTYVLILLFDRVILGDDVPSLRWAGVAFIVGGLLLVSRTQHS